MHDTDTMIRRLSDLLDHDAELVAQLEASLTKAREIADGQLDADTMQALTWPKDRDEYQHYLRAFIRWIPQESDAASISDRLSHFYWLIDQHDDDDALMVQTSEAFGDWLTEFAREWGSFLDTTESFSPEILQSFRERPEYEVDDSLVAGQPSMPSGWLTFNQFFARQLNGGMRPIADPSSNLVVARPADSQLKHVFHIGADSTIPETTLKKTHTFGGIGQLLDGSRYADSYAGGTFLHYFLTPFDYHRFHLPVSGVVQESFTVQGRAVQRIDLEDQEFVVRDSALTGHEFWQTRGIVTIDTSDSEAGDIGIVTVIPVGMWQVASVVLTATEGKRMAKGDEFGYFQFGGSEVIVLLQEGVVAEVDEDPSHRRMGELAARCTPRGA